MSIARALSSRLGSARKLQALWLCWLTISSHAIDVTQRIDAASSGSQSRPNEDKVFEQPESSISPGTSVRVDKVPITSSTKRIDLVVDGTMKTTQVISTQSPELSSTQSSEETPRNLQSLDKIFFKTPPSANTVVTDTSSTHCDQAFESPPNSDPTSGPLRDGTDFLRRKLMACGVGIVRFNFYTSDLDRYEDTSTKADMQLRITTALARFEERETCENVLDATNFPAIARCRFMNNEARIVFSTRLAKNTGYSITMKMFMPPGRATASENNFVMSLEFYQLLPPIEETISPVDIIHAIPNAKDTAVYTDGYDKRGYVTGFTWQPQVSKNKQASYTSEPGADSKITFGLRTFGEMAQGFKLDVVLYPTNVWRIGETGAACVEFVKSVSGCSCNLASFPGAPPDVANGFTIKIGTTSFLNLEKKEFSLNLPNPSQALNGYWTITSYFVTPGTGVITQPYTVMMDKPVNVLGQPYGSGIIEYELNAIDAEQWVTLEFFPGNTLMPSSPDVGGYAGRLVIVPPTSFTVIDSATPRNVGSEYNALPCILWPEEERRNNRWVCFFRDRVPFKDTAYRIQLKVKNPPKPCAAGSWRIELWQMDAVVEATKPISISRNIRGIPISGRMQASLAPTNQLFGVSNLLVFDFRPSQDIGAMKNQRLRVTAPQGFIIIKRCLQFKRIILPECACKGSDLNYFDLTFPETNAIKGGGTYLFQIEVQNSGVNIRDENNYWVFNTVRPDGVGRDTARFKGFFLYPKEFQTFQVIPVSRKVGAQLAILRFTAMHDIPFDDYITVRAPLGVVWDQANLDFDTSNAATGAKALATGVPLIPPEEPNKIIMRLTDNVLAFFEYGFRARIHVPVETPVPNRWWIDQYRQTGLAPPDDWQYEASTGAQGFKTQVLVKTMLEPYNVVREAWENPTRITFETTMGIQSEITSKGTVLHRASLRLVAPEGFTYICPLTPTIILPEHAVNLPDDAECDVNHSVEAERRILNIHFKTGLKADTLYSFTVDVVNAKIVSPTDNFFTLSTVLDDEVMETKEMQGWKMASRMDDTRYVAFPEKENRRVAATDNVVTFVVGITESVATGSILEVKAPPGFKFPNDCTANVGKATWANNLVTGVMPEVVSCENLFKISPKLVNTIRVKMNGIWEAQKSYAFFVICENPIGTPPQNNWGITIYKSDMEVMMSEAWINGFLIQVVGDIVLSPYNPGNGISGEAAPNPMDIHFTLTTRLPHLESMTTGGIIIITAPEGFRFPKVCRMFFPDPGIEGKHPLPPTTTCAGDGVRTLKLTIQEYNNLEKETPYAFRVLVENPFFTYQDVTKYKWAIETRMNMPTSSPTDQYDLNATVPSFPLEQRIKYFALETLSPIGLRSTTVKVVFNMFNTLLPQKEIIISTPSLVKFGSAPGSKCIFEREKVLAAQFPPSLIKDMTRLPEWVTCKVMNKHQVLLKNNEPVRGGRPVIHGPTYEVFIQNVSNPQKTPELNLWRIEAHTTAPFGKEVWAINGYEIFPELTYATVRSSNPAVGLFTNFTFKLQTVTDMPEGGSFKIIAPNEHYYFGPRLKMEGAEVWDDLSAIPQPSGNSPPRPPKEARIQCSVMRTEDFTCTVNFAKCDELNEILALQTAASGGTGPKIPANLERDCENYLAKCNTGNIGELFPCVHYQEWDKEHEKWNSVLEITIAQHVSLRGSTGQFFEFIVTGYNTLYKPQSRAENNWHFITRNADSTKTTLDEKAEVPGFDLLGVIYVDSIIPSRTKVSTSENRVTLFVRLSTTVQPRAQLVIRHPPQFLKDVSLASQKRGIETKEPAIPRKAIKTHENNRILIELAEDSLVRDTVLEITVTLSNPPISPAEEYNIWQFETYNIAGQRAPKRLDCNLDVSGFRIFGEFRKIPPPQIVSHIPAPGQRNQIGVWFVLESPLPASETSYLRIWLPRDFTPEPECGGTDFKLSYRQRKGPEAAQIKNPFPPDRIAGFEEIFAMGCEPMEDKERQTHYVLIKLDAQLDYGVDYAFEFAIRNAEFMPPKEFNVWHFETLMHNIVLHRQRDIESFELEMIKTVTIKPADTTALLALNRIEFDMLSEKYIPGGSKIHITAPKGFIFTCAFFRVRGLSNTTTCFAQGNLVSFTVDSADAKKPNFPFTIIVYVSNPMYTPQPNSWGFGIVSALGDFIDSRAKVAGFDVTGELQAEIRAQFPYKGQRNLLTFVFLPTTILNQADEGNELAIHGPEGYFFGKNCSAFDMYLTLPPPDDPDPGMYGSDYKFPPPGTTCTGFDNSSFTIRFPNGIGLLRANYSMQINVKNPLFEPNISNNWVFVSRVRNEEIGQRIVDANRELPGFSLRTLEPVRQTDAGAAPLPQRLAWAVALLIAPFGWRSMSPETWLPQI